MLLEPDQNKGVLGITPKYISNKTPANSQHKASILEKECL